MPLVDGSRLRDDYRGECSPPRPGPPDSAEGPPRAVRLYVTWLCGVQRNRQRAISSREAGASPNEDCSLPAVAFDPPEPPAVPNCVLVVSPVDLASIHTTAKELRMNPDSRAGSD